jgi:hypothetical protein
MPEHRGHRPPGPDEVTDPRTLRWSCSPRAFALAFGPFPFPVHSLSP